MTRIAQPDRNAPASEWTVYADALQEANDPRGELIALNQAVAKGMSTADRDAYVAKHRTALFGPDHADSFRVTEWIGCVADRVEVRITATDSAEAVMTAFLASPLAAAHAITLAGVPSGRTAVDVSAALAKLVAQWPASARVLALVDERAAGTTMLASRDMEPPENLVKFGPLAAIWKLPIEELRIDVADSHQLDLGTIDAPELRRFTLNNLRYSTPFEGDVPMSAVLAKASWPKLESFALRCTEEYMANVIADEGAYIEYYFGNEDWEDRMDEAEVDGENVEGTNWGQLQAVLENLKKSPLKRLALTSFDSTQSLLQTIARAGLPPTLEELDLSDSSISSTEWFTENKAMFFSVKKLVLDNTTISDDDAAALGSLGPAIQHKSGSAPKYRYIVGQE